MRDHVRAAIQAAYPGHVRGLRDRSRLDREVRAAEILALVAELAAPAAGDVSVEPAHEYDAFCEEPPLPLREFTKRVHATLGQRGFSHVDPSELQEEVPFVDPGDTMVKERRVTVFNCLFSEV
jgi:hypothetical protein